MHSEHHAMSWTVHRFQTILSFVFRILLNYEHVLLVFVPMTTLLPQIAIIPGIRDYLHVRGNDFRVTSEFVLVSHYSLQLIVEFGSVGEEKGTSCTHLVEFEQVLVHTDFTVVPFCDFFLYVNVFFHFFFWREGDSVNSLQVIVVFMT